VASTVKKYLTSTGRLPEDALLGYIAFTLGADGEHDRDKLVAEFTRRGLDSDYVPRLSRAVDAFKKAIRSQQEFRYPMSAATQARVLFREVDSPNPNEVSLRALMREERTDTLSRLAYDKVGEVKLFHGPRRNGTVDDSGARFAWSLAKDLNSDERAHLTRLGVLIKADYTRHMTSLDGIRIRAMILSFMRNELQAVPWKASVHFVPITGIDKLREFSAAISTLKGCTVDLVPLVDLIDQREHVLEALQADTEACLGELLIDLNKARAGNTTPKTYAALRHRYDAVMARSEDYAKLLDLSAGRTAGATDVAKAMLSQISRQFITHTES
jgi:hypothetical protein